MILDVIFSKRAEKSLKEKKISREEVFTIINKFVRKLKGENINIDIKKLRGEWFGFFRIRVGKIRIIIEFDSDNQSVFIEAIDTRGNIYK